MNVKRFVIRFTKYKNPSKVEMVWGHFVCNDNRDVMSSPSFKSKEKMVIFKEIRSSTSDDITFIVFEVTTGRPGLESRS